MPPEPTTRSAAERIHVGFIVTAPYQLFHYGAIRRHLHGRITAYIELRENDFGVSRGLVERHMAPCHVQWIASDDLGTIDGKCDVVICQTPVTVMKFFTKSLVVAQQYSLAKEHYQYGVWRSQADLNLMYGNYSANTSSPFSRTLAVGNPLFDGFVPIDGLLEPRTSTTGRLRVLYMPTYGDLSNRRAALQGLMTNDVELSVKAHHADFEIKNLADENGIPIFLSETNPVELILDHDLVVSDYSGAIYDALSLRTPVALVSALNPESTAIGRLSSDDLSHANVTELASTWTPGEPIRRAYVESAEKLSSDTAYRAFLDHFYVNVGEAGGACADAIEELVATGPTLSFAARLVRETTRTYIEQNRTLRAKLKKSERGSVRRLARAALKRRSPWAIAKGSARYALRALPGGERITVGLRGARADDARNSRGPADAAGHSPSATLSPLAHVRRSQIADLLRTALNDANVDHRSCASDHFAYLAVREDDLDSLHRALNTLGNSTDLRFASWLGTGAKYTAAKDVGSLRMHDLAAAESVVIGVPYQNEYYSLDRDGGVEILILTHRGSRLVSRLKRAEKVDWTGDFATISTTSRPTGARRSAPAEKTGNEYVDIVYTWVDSSDAEWKRQRAQWSGQAEIVMASAANDERYLDRDELRYSLRSVMMYAPFVRNIYIVTHGHRPSWLVDHDRIQVIPHHEIFPDATDLPTFNSHAIEACLHRVPGLSENFLYFNDDVFLGRPTTFHDFYTKAGLIKSRFSPSSFVAGEEPAPDAIPTDWASYNAVRLMREDFGLDFDRKLKHVPHPLKRSLLEELEQRYPDVFERTRSSRFREPADYAIPSMLAHYYGIATHRAVEWDNLAKDYIYADTGRADLHAKMSQILTRDPMFICLNVTLHSDIDLATQAKLIREFMSKRYPIRSPFEGPSA